MSNCVHREAAEPCYICMSEDLRASRDLNRYMFDLLPPVCDEFCISQGCQKESLEETVGKLRQRIQTLDGTESTGEKERCIQIVKKWALLYPPEIFSPVSGEESGPLGDLAERIAAQAARHLAKNIVLDIQGSKLVDWPPCCPQRDSVGEERDALLAMTAMLDEHPEGYDGPCCCKLCQSYAEPS